jgi:hypothetical protein
MATSKKPVYKELDTAYGVSPKKMKKLLGSKIPTVVSKSGKKK